MEKKDAWHRQRGNINFYIYINKIGSLLFLFKLLNQITRSNSELSQKQDDFLLKQQEIDKKQNEPLVN